MLKQFVILLLCGLCTFNIQGQNFGGGLILGISSSQVGGDNLAGFNKAGMLVGVFANRKISNVFGFQMEMTYIQKGSNNPEMKNYNHQNVGVADISLSYIEIPVFIQYQQNNNLKLEGGIYGAYLIDGYYNDLFGRIPSIKNPFINYDTGLLIGISYTYSEHISLNTRISNSIFPIGFEDYDGILYYNNLTKGKYNSVLSFALHYNF
tara:strand:- start:11806 stop:12426 length:621 start_codon:yes stop_codon:yes gene_type:complete